MNLDERARVTAFLEKAIPALVTAGEYELENEAAELLRDLSPILGDFPNPCASLRAMKEQFESAKPM